MRVGHKATAAGTTSVRIPRDTVAIIIVECSIDTGFSDAQIPADVVDGELIDMVKNRDASLDGA